MISNLQFRISKAGGGSEVGGQRRRLNIEHPTVQRPTSNSEVGHLGLGGLLPLPPPEGLPVVLGPLGGRGVDDAFPEPELPFPISCLSWE